MDNSPPKAYEDFVARFPGLGTGWEQLRQGARDAGPLDEKTLALTKLGMALGSRRTGPVHSATRKALSAGATHEEIEQVVAQCATTLGLPSAVAGWTWVRDVLDA